jgi:6-phosphogluconolactonase
MTEISVYPDTDQLMQAAAEQIISAGNAAIAAHGRFDLALTGGSTPGPLYRLLTTAPYAARLDWGAVHVFWGDERCVPPQHPDSNYRLARETLLDHVPLPAANVHRIHGEDDPVQAALAYESTLRAHFGAVLRFDLVLLGLGADGHAASLFPNAPALTERQRLAVAAYAAEHKWWRVTLTYPVLNAAAQVIFLVSSGSKADIVRAVLEGPRRPQELPAQGVQPHDGRLLWMLDADAAVRLART